MTREAENQNRVTLVTGGARGIGLAVAQRFAASGETVVIADILEDEGKESAEGIDGVFHQVDVASEDSVRLLVDDVERDTGPIGALVNSAGLLQTASTSADMPMEEHDRIWQVNYRGTYLCCRAVGHRMAERGAGAILNIGSINSLRVLPLPAYTPGKAAIKSLTELLAAELGPGGVRVNAVAPGFTLTPALQERIDSGERDLGKIERTTALGRLVMPGEIAEAGYYLCSGQASAITGVCLPVDCGWLAAVTYKSFPG